MKLFTKGELTGKLMPVNIDHCITRKSKIVWTTKKVLMLLNDEGYILSPVQFRSNAFKKAEQYLINSGWSVSE